MRNTADVVLGTNIRFIITDLYVKCCRNLIGNEQNR